MEASAAFRGGRISTRTFVALLAIVLAFALGSASGYLVKAITTPAATSPASACPAGSHAVVWYTANTWACVSNITHS